jgi:hypothetical protein
MLAAPSANERALARNLQGKRMRQLSLVSGALLLVACGGAAIPQEQLTTAKAAISGAQVAGAPNEPKAELHLKLAKEQVAKAEALIADGDNEEAARLLDRALVDAELAFALASETKSKTEAATTKEQLDRLKKETQ